MGKEIRRTYGSLSEFVDRALSPFDNGIADARRQSIRDDWGTPGWYRTESLPAACVLAFDWAEGVASIERHRAQLSAIGSAPRRQTHMVTRGGRVSMGAYAAGKPRPVVKRVPAPGQQAGNKIIKVVVNFAASSNVKSEVYERRGAAILSLIDSLEKAGRRVELRAVCAVSSYRSGKYVTDVMVKPASQRLNLRAIAFAIAHPSMLRRLHFSAVEHEPTEIHETYGPGGSYGSPCEIETDADTLYIGSMLDASKNFVWTDPTRAANWVRETAATYGVKIG